MSAEIRVYFTCRICGHLYLATQVRYFEGTRGNISCVRCATAVHSWSGIYDYRFWKPIDLTGIVSEA
jgi:hypothetical protein